VQRRRHAADAVVGPVEDLREGTSAVPVVEHACNDEGARREVPPRP
jgi:hypothetical protein